MNQIGGHNLFRSWTRRPLFGARKISGLRAIIIGLGAGILLGQTASAQYYMGFCSEPSEPYCVNSSFNFDDEYSFDSCRRQVEQYVSQMNDYTSCLANELDQKLNEIQQLRNDINGIKSEHADAQEKANKVIEEFNCRAGGGTYC